MLLGTELLNILDGIETSYIDFNNSSALLRFVEIFKDKWEDAVLKVINEYYNMEDEYEIEEFKEENEAHIYAFYTDFGFRAVFSPLYIIDQWESRAWTEEALEALELSLNQLEKEFPGLKYKGCVQFVYSDTHCGDSVQFEINVDKDYIHPYIGEMLRLNFQDYGFWDDIKLYAEDLEEVKEDLMNYKDYFLEDTESEINFVCNR